MAARNRKTANPGLVAATSGKSALTFITALARHRHHQRETDPPAI